MKTTYEKNLDTIRSINENLANWIEAKPHVDWCTIVKNKKDHSNLLIKKGAKLELAYNKDNPKKDIKKIVKNLKLFKNEASIVVGFGLGYLVYELLKKAEVGHKVLVIESAATMYKYAFSLVDFSKYILRGDLSFASPGKEEAALLIQVMSESAVISNWQIFINEYTQKRPNEYSKIVNHVIETVNQVRSNIGTVMGAGKILADNDINNLPYVIRHRGVNELKDLFKDKPAVLICTGPSLEKNIHELIPIQDKVIIIAVAQALRILLAYDITPDFITTVDFGETNLGHYKGLMNSTVPLVCLNRTYAKILKQYRGPKFIVATSLPGYEKTAAGILLNKGTIASGGSVAHLSLMLAYQLGCDPIMFLGQDLSLVDNKSHNRQADESGTIRINEHGSIMWDVQDHRSHLTKTNEGVYTMGMPITVPGYLGDFVITNTGLASFILAFKNLIEAFFKDRLVINCTEGGAKIEGTKQLSFHKAIEKYCNESIDKSILDPLLSLADDADELIERVIPLLEQDIETLNTIEKESLAALKTCTQLKKHQKNPYKMKKYFKENEKHTLIAQRLCIRIPLMGVAIYNASRKIHNRELKVKGGMYHLLNNKKDLNARIKRNRLILTDAKKAAVELLKGYKEALRILKKFQKTKDESLLMIEEEYIPSVKDAFDFFRKGNFARPLLDAKSIIKQELENLLNTSSDVSMFLPGLREAYKIKALAINLRNKSIKKAIKYYRNIDNLLEYLELMEENKKAGREELKKSQQMSSLEDPINPTLEITPDQMSALNFNKAYELLKKAVDLFPDKEHSLWGYATTLHHMEKYDESIEEYKRLISMVEEKRKKIGYLKRTQEFVKRYEKKEETNELKIRILTIIHNKKVRYDQFTTRILRYKHELGQVMIMSKKIDEGMNLIQEVMKETDEFNVFLNRIGDLYFAMGKLDKAIKAYGLYLKYFPNDFIAWGKKGDCHRYMTEKCPPSCVLIEDAKANKCYNRLRQLKPDVVIEDFYFHKRKNDKKIHLLNNINNKM